MLLTRNALGNLLARYRAVLRHCRWKNALAALLLTGMVALPVENLWANSGGTDETIASGWGYIGIKGASNNDVVFDENPSDIYKGAAGGYSDGTINPGGKAENNVLRINSTVDRAIGGNVDVSNGVASATNNKLLIEGGTVRIVAHGGLAHSIGSPATATATATATGNSLSIESNGKAGEAYGGNALVTNSGTATATSNALSIKYRGLVMGQAYGGYAEASSCTATGNTLTIEGFGKVGWRAYGGYAGIKSAGTATAKNNALGIKDSGSVGENADPGEGNAYGGYAHVGDGEGTAMGNTLTIEDGGSVRDNAYGGYVSSFGSSSIITVTGNTVFLNGGSFGAGKRVYGGYAKVAGTGNVTDNTVVLGASLKANTLAAVELYGGGYEKTSSGSGTATVSNNTLEVWGHGLTARAINNFENLYFILPASIKAGDTVLTLNGGAPTVFNTKANVGVAVAAGARPLNVGDKVTLLKNASGLHNKNDDTLVQGTDYQKVSLEGKTLKGGQGISLEYDFTLSNTDTTLDATVAAKPDPEPTPLRAETKAVVEARAAAAAVLNGAGDLAAGNGIRNALAGFASPQGQSGMASGDATGIAAHVIPFAAVSGGWQRVESGSHANISGLAAMVGLAGQVQFAAANFLAGAFFEFGTSRMDTHNSFASGDVDGKGHASYTGGGILARLDVTESLLRGLYVEGTFRFGGLNSDWHTDDLRDAATGRRAQFDMYAPYIGGHAGLGYVWQATDSLKLDVYGKYLWTRLYGDDAMVALDRYEFDTVDSQRLRLGARLDWQFSESASVYVGAAWEHEFNGEARATTYGMETPAPTMEGDTGVFDLGLSFTPAPNLTVEAGLTGYAGMRQGIGGNVLVKYSF